MSEANKKPEGTGPASDDKELDDLLDSALEDFSKEDGSSKKATTGGDGEHDDPPTEQLWNEEFITSQTKLFEEKMSALFGGGEGSGPVDAEQIALGFQRIAEAAALAVRGDPAETAAAPEGVDPSISQSITDALRGLSEGRENLQTPFNPEDIAGMFGNIDLNESGENNAFLPFMQTMMQSLLSAEVLLPSLKDLTEKYPDWLRENGDKVPKEDKERYEKQLKMMEDVCRELEQEKADDPADVKRTRFQKVLEMMQSMQDLGQPPADLVGDLGGPGNMGLPTLDPSAFSDPNQCPTS